MMSTQTHVRYRIRELRKAAGLTQSELARQLGVVRHVINDYESDRYRPTAARAAALCSILKCTISELMVLD